MAKMLLSNLSSGPHEVPSPRGIRRSPTNMAEPSSAAAPPAVKRACDACHRRKVKCIGDGSRPCKNCTSAGLTCTYNAIPQKKGPKGSRAKVISELRENQRQSQLAAAQQHGFEEAPHSPAYLRKAGLLSMEMITSCVDFFFANIYPTQPILHRVKVGETIGQMETSVEAYCLVVSLCAYMMIQPNMNLPPGAFHDIDVQPQPSIELGQQLLQETLRVRKGYDYVETPTVWTVITSFFLFGSYFCLDKHNTAWFHLREATTLAQIMGMHDESHYQMTADVIENSRKRRLYWLLFVTERAYALQQHRPLTLQSTINPPRLDEDPSETVELSGFIHLVNLFRPFDDTFVGLWNKARTGCTTEWLARLQQQLSDALPAYLQSTESQAVDLRCSQQWLRTMVWQLSISHGYLSSVANDNAMSFRYPIEISRDLVAATSTFSQQAMEVHGIGLIEKLFDVACTLTDVMSCVPYEQHTFEYGPRDYLNQLMTLISSLRGGQQRYMPLLLSKVNEAMPQMPTHGFSIPMGPPTSRLGIDELYDSASQGHAHSSTASTPFGSPPLSSATASMVGFPQDSTYASVSSGVGYPGIPAASAPLSMYQHGPEPPPSMRNYPTSNPMQKFEGQG